MLRAACWLWTIVIMVIMWLPDPDFGGVDLSSPIAQGGSFAVGAALFALADQSRPHFFRRRDSDGLLNYLVVRFRRHLVRIAAMLIGFAVILEVGQFFEVGRVFRFSQLARNVGWILVASAVIYALTRLLVVNGYLGRITQRHLRRVSAALRNEAMYSARLRDISQAAYAVCTATSTSAEEKLQRVYQLLDEALGEAMPNHDEELLDTVFGPRKASPAPYRPSVGAADPRRGE